MRLRPPAPLGAAPPASRQVRTIAGLFCLGLLAVLSLAAWLTPAVAGFGTHRQLGLAPCNWAQAFGRPCATCGMTTAFASAANLDFRASFLAQPLGMLLAVLAATAVWPLGYIALTGSNLGTVLLRLANGKTAAGFVLLLVLAWAYKVITWPTH